MTTWQESVDQPVTPPRWKDDILPGLIQAQARRDSDREQAYSRPSHTPRSTLGDRSQWRPVDPTDPWGELVNREGMTPDGRCLFPKRAAA
jgi:hypothetical protein